MADQEAFSDSPRRGRWVRWSRSHARWIGLAVLLGAVAAVAVLLVLAYRPPIHAIAPPSPTAFSPESIERGSAVAALGDCSVCHTAEAGAFLAGGRPLPTPFGTIFSTNITPDQATGIGAWSLVAFKRAMRQGVSRDGHLLYPAMPYDHYAHVSDQDLDDLYAFLMTRSPQACQAPRNRLIFPLGFRQVLAGWQLLYLRHTLFTPTPSRSAQWNRGAYLAAGLAHCGGCHSPRDLAGGEAHGRAAYTGGVAEGWNAPALTPSNPAAVRWTQTALYDYLRTGVDPKHSAAAGPMAPVVEDLSRAPNADVEAIATYIASLAGAPSGADATGPADREELADRTFPHGKVLFQGACAGCHDLGAPMLVQGRPALGLVSAVREDDPRDALQAILQGLTPLTGGAGPYMPDFANGLSDRDVAEVAAYVRARYSDRPPWRDLERAASKARAAGG
jgi:mono/diheme cytochrome c family protein